MRGGLGGRLGSGSVRSTTAAAVREQNRSGGAHNSLRVPRPDPPLLPSIIFPLGPPFCGDECRAERALGAAEFFPRHGVFRSDGGWAAQERALTPPFIVSMSPPG